MTGENLLVIMSDQHHAGFAGHAGHPVVKTPNFDRLAERGTRFASAYTPSPICVPARASFATGAQVFDHRYWDNAIAYDGAIRGWGHLLQEAGIRCESIGKLHYRNESDPTGFDRQTLPMHIKDGIGQVWGALRDPLPVRENGELFCSTAGPGESDYTRYDAAITGATCDWIERHGSDGPWMLYVGLVAPHPPYVSPQRFFDLYADYDYELPDLHPETGYVPHPWVKHFMDTVPGTDRNTREERRRTTIAYMGLVSYLDHNVGAIMNALDAAGIADRTTLIYTSDHGDQVGRRGQWNKSMPYEESARIPMIASGGDFGRGETREAPVSLLDISATIPAFFGITASHDDGVDRPGLDLRGTMPKERPVISEYHAYGAISPWFLIRREHWKLIHYHGFDPELFDLASDPGETSNLADDPHHSDLVHELKRELEGVVGFERTDRLARKDQQALIDRFGGPDAALHAGTQGVTPAPKT